MMNNLFDNENALTIILSFLREMPIVKSLN